jgi:hypothetical protein
MGRYATDTGGKFQDAPAGTHMGRCYSIIDLGTQHGDYGVNNQVMVRFELPEELMDDGRPFSVAAFWTNSTNEKATLRIVLETWRGKPFTQEEIDRFDLEKIIGVPGLVTIGPNKKGRMKIMGVGPLMKGQKCPPQVNPAVTFWLDEFDRAVFDSLPDGLQAIIKESDEYKARLTTRGPVEPPARTNDFDDDIPF